MKTTDTNNEVARLRELLNRAIEAAEEAIRLADIDYENDKFGKVTWLKEEVSEIETEARLAPEPEEPVTEKASKFSVNPSFYEKCNVCGESYGDHTGHPDDPYCPLQSPVSDWKCPHCGSTTGTWFSRVEPMGYICEDCGKAVDEEPATSWRELGPDEVIQEGDESICTSGIWSPCISTIGDRPQSYPAPFRFRTRRPLCPNDAPKQEYEHHNHLHAWMRLQESINKDISGFWRTPKPPQRDPEAKTK